MKTPVNWDAVGITATLACAIHCALLPLFLTSLPLFGVNIIHNTYFEVLMIIAAFLIGGYSLWHGRMRHHHQTTPSALFIAGMIFLFTKEVFADYAQWLLIPAVILIVSAHILNWRLCRKAKHCHATDCNH